MFTGFKHWLVEAAIPFLGLVIVLGLIGLLAYQSQAATIMFRQTVITPAACNDGLDNDGDTLIDWPNDPDCASLEDDNESAEEDETNGNDGGQDNPPTWDSLVTERADFDDNGVVNMSDFAAMINRINNSARLSSTFDLNKDGSVDLQDVSILVYYLQP